MLSLSIPPAGLPLALVNEHEIRESPIVRSAWPPDDPHVLGIEEVERLLAACAGTSFEDRRVISDS